jgi:hypothetical protein
MSVPVLVPPQQPRAAQWITHTIVALGMLFAGGLVLSAICWGSVFFFHWPRALPPELTIPMVAGNVVVLVVLAVLGPVVLRRLRYDGQPLYKKWLLLAGIVLTPAISFAALFYDDPAIMAAIITFGGWLPLIPILLFAHFSYRSFRKHTGTSQSAGHEEGR